MYHHKTVKVVWRDGMRPEDVEGLEVFIPRPIRKEVLKEVLERAVKVYMPSSTLERISRRLREEYAEKIGVESVRGRYAVHDPELVARVAALRKSGMSVRKIAEEVGLPKSTVHYILTRMRKLEVGEERIIL